MDGFEKQYLHTSAQNHNIKFVDATRRAIVVNMRAKIKPVERRPDLLVMQQHMRLRGGDYHYPTEDLFYTPTSSAFESGAMTSNTTGQVSSALAGNPSEVAPVSKQMFGSSHRRGHF